MKRRCLIGDRDHSDGVNGDNLKTYLEVNVICGGDHASRILLVADHQTIIGSILAVIEINNGSVSCVNRFVLQDTAHVRLMDVPRSAGW